MVTGIDTGDHQAHITGEDLLPQDLVMAGHTGPDRGLTPHVVITDHPGDVFYNHMFCVLKKSPCKLTKPHILT